MFLAHFSATPLNVLLDMDIADLCYWYNEANKLHMRMNKPLS